MDNGMPPGPPPGFGFGDGPPMKPNQHAHTILIFVCGVFASLFLSISRRLQASERDRMEAELSLLKAQINPHFFFNTLNNIYSLTFSDIPLSRDALLKLSRMMRYVLYETISDTSLVSKEMDFVHDYIELMTIRVPSYTTVNFTESKPHRGYRIAPMLLLPFIENAFKHGINAVKESKISIDLSVQNDALNLHVFNDINTDLDKDGIDQKGIGLQNTRKRLDLLYPDKYSLVIDDSQANTYEIALRIDLEPI
jgi:LytS/YehU family sensor histidine kinase